jgi:hypothetical protein
MDSLRARRELAIIALLATMCLPSCLVRRRVVAVPGKNGKKENRPLLTATTPDLIERVHAVSDPIRSFSVKVDMSPSVGNLYGGEVTDYATITGFILFLRPDYIRVIGQDPVIHSTAFDMVSTGNDFRVSIPAKSQFITGQNSSPANSSNKLENLRPAAFLNSLLIKPPDPADILVLEDDTNETKAVYILMMLRRDGNELRPVRNLYFDRYTLQISRQKTFDDKGYITSDAEYNDWKYYNRVRFPSSIDIKRPQDGYEVQLSILQMKMNPTDITPEKFILNQPPGSHLKVLK